MKSRAVFLLTLAGAMTAGPAAAQEKYTIKLKELSAGETWKVDMEQTASFKVKETIEKEKEPRIITGANSLHDVFIETILEKPAGAKAATKAKRVYQQALRESTDVNAKEKQRPYHGKTVLIEKKGDKYEFRIEGGSVVENDPALLGDFEQDRQQNKKLFVPPGPVAVKDSWKADPALFLGDLAKTSDLKVAKAEGTATLVKVYKKEGRLYGIIEANVVLEFTAKSRDDKPGQGTTTDSKAHLQLTFDGCIDGSFAETHIKGDSESQATTTFRMGELPAVTSVTVARITFEHFWTELPRK